MQQTVPMLSIGLMALSVVLAIGTPIVLAVLCCRGRKGTFTEIMVGAAGFFVGALVLEQFCHALVFRFFPNLAQNPVAYCLYACLAAGFFEETARLVGLNWLCKQDSSPMAGLAYGVGHGGFEAINIGFGGLMSNLSLMMMINGGQAASLLESVSEEQRQAAQAQLDALCTSQPITFLAGGVERVITLAFHIALSMIVWMVVTGRIPRWGYFVAVGIHALADVSAVLYQLHFITSVWLTEALIFVFTVVVCYGVVQMLKKQGVACPIKR